MVDTQAVLFAAVALLTILSGDIWRLLRNRIAMTFVMLLWGLTVYGLLTGLLISPERGFPHTALRVMRAATTLVGCFSVLVLIARLKKISIAKLPLVEYVFFAIVAHAVIMAIQFFNPAFREAIYDYTVNRDVVVGARLYYSMAGLTSGGGAQLSVYQAIGVLIAPLLLRDSHSVAHRIFIALCGLLCLFAVFISGRSGLIVVIIFLPLMVLMLGRTAGGYLKSLSAAAVVVGSLLFTVSILGVATDATDEEASENAVIALVTVMFRAQEMLFGEDATFETLASGHMMVPDDLVTLVAGNPRLIEYDQSFADRIVDSDIGYVRLLYGYGLAGSLLHYMFYVLVAVIAFHVYRRGGPYRDHAAFALVFSLIILLFNLKEVFVLTRIGFSITSLSIVLLSFQIGSVRRVRNEKMLVVERSTA